MNFKKKCTCIIATFIGALWITTNAYATEISVPNVQGPLPVTEDSSPFNAVAHQTTPIDLTMAQYVEEEYFISGKANIYQWSATGTTEIRTPNTPYTNRIIVRKPSDPKKISGNVFVEMVNSTSTYDSQVLWYANHDKFLRDGDIYVGITTKPIAIKALKKYDPIRYAPLSWANPLPPEQRGITPGNYMPSGVPGSFPETEDGLIWDIISQTGALLRSTSASNPLHGYNVEKIYSIGASQSAILLTTYINAIHPTVSLANNKPIFDGYLLTVGAYPLQIHQDAPILLPTGDPRITIRNCDVPVIRIMSETDFRSMGPWPFLAARRADSDSPSDRFRLYEIPGSSHSTFYTIQFRSGKDELAAIGKKKPDILNYVPNNFPSQYIFRGALVNLDKWVRQGTPPPHASPIELNDSVTEKDVFGNTVPVIMRDQFGNALGGLRTPYLDVPIATYAPNSPQNPLSGQMFLFDQERLQQLYSTHEMYVQRFSEKVDVMVNSKWITAVDGEHMKQEARQQSTLQIKH